MVSIRSKKIKVREFDNPENALHYKRDMDRKHKNPYIQVIKSKKKGMRFKVYSL